ERRTAAPSDAPSPPSRCRTGRRSGRSAGRARDEAEEESRMVILDRRVRPPASVCQDHHMTTLGSTQLAALIDHTLLKPQSTRTDVNAQPRNAGRVGSPPLGRPPASVCQDHHMTTLDRTQLAALIDHTLLKPDSTRTDVTALLREAEELGTYSVCLSPSMLPVETTVKVATVCGFPSGQHSSAIKAAEAAESVSNGADEVDMVINVGLVRSGDLEAAEAEVRAVREAAPSPVVLKVIIESAALTDEQIVG